MFGQSQPENLIYLRLLYQPISRPHAEKISIIVAFSCIKASVAKFDLAVNYGQGHPRVIM